MNLIEQLRQLRYINRGIVFFFDLLISALGTLLSFVFIISLNVGWHMHGAIPIILCCSVFISAILFVLSGQYKIIIRHSAIKELMGIFYILIAKDLFLLSIAALLVGKIDKWIVASALLDVLITAFLMIGFRSLIVNIYYTLVKGGASSVNNTLMYGTTGNSPSLAAQINKDVNSSYFIKGFLTTNSREKDTKIVGQHVYYLDENYLKLGKVITGSDIRCVIFSSRKDFEFEKNNLVEFCINNKVKIYVAGELKSPDEHGNIRHELNPINIEDLLDRDEIQIDTDKIGEQVNNKTILITGAAGSIGSEIVVQLTKFDVKQLVLFDTAETPLHNLQLTINELNTNIDVIYCLGDVRSSDRVTDIFKRFRPDMVFHAAAYKHVPMIEGNPCESILTNVWGTVNLARTAQKFGTAKFVMISTDKAVNPTNVMGASKRIAEMCVQSMNKDGNTRFITTRFGNVLGSNGSVIPLFTKQINERVPITVTDASVVRYFMTIPEACRLVLQAATMGQGGELFLFDMGNKVKIVDLARKMVLLSGLRPDIDIPIVFTGLRPGEKLYEEDLSAEEQTTVTNHHKIKIAKVKEFTQVTFENNVKELISFAKRVDIDKTIRMMKQIVPEYISNNSEFICYDNIKNTKKNE